MALLDHRNLTSEELVLKGGLLKTNGALTKMNVPNGWSAKQSSEWRKDFDPALPLDVID